jgi:hypothetical protein
MKKAPASSMLGPFCLQTLCESDLQSDHLPEGDKSPLLRDLEAAVSTLNLFGRFIRA